MLDVGLQLTRTHTKTSVTFVKESGEIEHYEYESITYGEAERAHRVAHALRDLAFHIDLKNSNL